MTNTTDRMKISRVTRRPRDHHEETIDLAGLDPNADGLTILQHILNASESNADLSETILEQEVVAVEKLFSEGRISAEAAAERLGLSLPEFFAEFVFDESSVPGITQEERQMLSIKAAEALDEVNSGRTIRAFIRDCVLTDEHLAFADFTMGEEAAHRLRHAAETLPAKLLGIALRQALSVGYSLPEFVELSIFNQEWAAVAGIEGEALSELIDRTVAALKLAHEYLLNDINFSALHVREKEISDRSVERLSYALARRRIRIARELVVGLDNRRLLVSPSQRNAAVLLNLYAQWIEFDYAYLQRVEEVLRKFRHLPVSGRSAHDAAHLDIAEGLVHLHNEKYKQAIVHFRYALARSHSIRDRDLLATCLYYLSRCYWKLGLYIKALHYASRAKQRNKNLARPEREAVIEILEAWLLLLLCERKEAERRLQKARKVIAETDDFGNHANALSFSGRLCKDKGQYQKALELFEDALWYYQRADARHRNIPRTYINMADVCFLDARRLLIDPECRARVLERRLEAFEYLAIAEDLYLLDPERNYRGLGKLHNLRALLYAASGEFEEAKAEVEKAYGLGSQKKDHLVMGKARKNQWAILTDEKCSPATQRDGEVSDEAILAFASAEDGLRHALQTNNKRLQARCYLYLGHSLLRLSCDYAGAERYLAEARACLDASPCQENSSQPSPSQQSYWNDKLRALQNAINNCRKETTDPKQDLSAENWEAQYANEQERRAETDSAHEVCSHHDRFEAGK
jgi:tetratricopeptide (TPR) repeat protein